MHLLASDSGFRMLLEENIGRHPKNPNAFPVWPLGRKWNRIYRVSPRCVNLSNALSIPDSDFDIESFFAEFAQRPVNVRFLAELPFVGANHKPRSKFF